MYGLNDVLKASDISTDYLGTRRWNLFHHAGYHTYGHKDAAGLCTFVVIDCGVKMWNIIRPSGLSSSYSAFEAAQLRVIEPDTDAAKDKLWRKRWHGDGEADVALLQLEEGDLL